MKIEKLKIKSKIDRMIDKFYEERIKGYIYQRQLEIELTSYCANRCPYCGNASGSNRDEIEFERIVSFIEKTVRYLNERGIRLFVTLCGGDPFEYSHINQLIEYLQKKEISFLVKSNTHSINELNIKALKEMEMCAVKYTMFGGQKAHKKWRGKDSFESLMEKTLLAKEYSVRVEWNVNVMDENLDETIETLENLDAVLPDAITIGRISKIGRLKEREFKQISPQRYREFLDVVYKFIINKSKDQLVCGFKENLWVPYLSENKVIDIHKYSGTRFLCGCNAYINLISVSNMGMIRGCSLLPDMKLDTVYNDDIDLKRLYMFPKAINDNSECNKCKYFGFCRGCPGVMAEKENGCVDPQCWVI